MWFTILFNIAISIIIIIIANHIWEYCKVNYTSQKTKNLIEIHASKYKQIAEDIKHASNSVELSPPPPPPIVNPFLREDEKEWIQTELTAFLDAI
jgi:hypothetical protein